MISLFFCGLSYLTTPLSLCCTSLCRSLAPFPFLAFRRGHAATDSSLGFAVAVAVAVALLSPLPRCPKTHPQAKALTKFLMLKCGFSPHSVVLLSDDTAADDGGDTPQAWRGDPTRANVMEYFEMMIKQVCDYSSGGENVTHQALRPRHSTGACGRGRVIGVWVAVRGKGTQHTVTAHGHSTRSQHTVTANNHSTRS